MEQLLIKNQLNFFDTLSLSCQNEMLSNVYNIKVSNLGLIEYDSQKYINYTTDDYTKDILVLGLKQTWKNINHTLLHNKMNNGILSLENLAQLYEMGLAIQNKQSKKKSGQYYTPKDVANLMANWFDGVDGENICDVACGTGELILAYLDKIGTKKSIELIREGKLYLYDVDEIALDICKTILLLKYGKDLAPNINTIQCDFLSKEIKLPPNCKVISNPPYSKVNSINPIWESTEVALKTKELYSIFMEKIIKQSITAVIISPYSFISGNKFFPLRKLMNNYNGFIVSFDNVPGNIFRGKKHGIFNSNTTNSVRAAITVVENKKGQRGFRTSPLIRFKNEERSNLLKTEVLEKFVDDKYQIIDQDNQMYYKCAKELNTVWSSWRKNSKHCLGDYVKKYGLKILSIPNTCRYYTVASNELIKRNGQIILNFDDENIYNYIFCLINSSFAYWYWRLYDGGITYTRSLLLSLPIFYDKLSTDDITFFNDMAKNMINNSQKYKTTKNNIGIQENIKYPKTYRDQINKRLLNILDINVDEKIFDIVHSNMALEVNVE